MNSVEFLNSLVGILLVACAPILGSFAGCAAWRIPRGMNWITGRSRCETCGAALGFRDLVPIVSFLALGGRCRHCGAGITPAWTAIELSFLAIAAAAALALPGGGAWAAAAPAWLLVFLFALGRCRDSHARNRHR